MRSIILAAGSGSRLGWQYSNTPKSLIDLGGRKILDRQLEVLVKNHVTEFSIVTGFEAHCFNFLHHQKINNPRFTETNMVYSFSLALEKLNVTGTVVSYGDVLYSPDSLSKLLRSNSDIAILSDMNWLSYWNERSLTPLDDLETFVCSPNQQLLEIGSRPFSIAEIMGQYIGVLYLSPDGVEKVKSITKLSKLGPTINGKSLDTAYMTDLIMELVSRGEHVQVVPFTDPWIEIDTLQDLRPEIINWRFQFIENQCLSLRN